MSLSKHWETPPLDEVNSNALVADFKLPFPVATCLVNRGFIDKEGVDKFLNPKLQDLSDPLLLPDMQKAVDRIWYALDNNESIVVFGDFDVDGICSTALLVHVLANLGAKVSSFLPHRTNDGYGLSKDALIRCIHNYSPTLVITVDCGTSSVEAVEYATKHDIDVIVTDHHEPSDEVARAFAIVNPKNDSLSPLHMLAGVGVTFKVCHALLKVARKHNRAKAHQLDLRQFLEYVALGTISDSVPLQVENRILTRFGLNQLNQTDSIGLRRLMEVAGVHVSADSYHVGFLLGPRINAAGRLGDATKALELLLTNDPKEAQVLANDLDHLNKLRKEVEAETVKHALKEIESWYNAKEHFGIVVSGVDWNPGVIGIVASRVSARYYRPVVVIAMNKDLNRGRGSCRSIPEFDLIRALRKCESTLLKFGGHTMAAGIELASGELSNFKNCFMQITKDKLQNLQLRPTQSVDAWISLAEANEDLFHGFEQLQPFGNDNPVPVLAVKNVQMVREPKIIGKHHLKMTIESEGIRREAIGFGFADRILPKGKLDIAFQIRMNRYMGKESIQLNLQDIRASTMV